jgi:hypothetical protein
MHRPSLVFKKLQVSKNWMETGTMDMDGVGNVKISTMRKNA